jgi:hypothetical protein
MIASPGRTSSPGFPLPEKSDLTRMPLNVTQFGMTMEGRRTTPLTTSECLPDGHRKVLRGVREPASLLGPI